MDYKKLNDNELVYLCCENNEDAINIIVEKYKPHIFTPPIPRSLPKDISECQREKGFGKIQKAIAYNAGP